MGFIKGDDGFSGIAVPPPGTFGALGDSAGSFGVVGLSGGPAGVYGESNFDPGENPLGHGIGVHGVCRAQQGIGVQGEGAAVGVNGTGTYGVTGYSAGGPGVWGGSGTNFGLVGQSYSSISTDGGAAAHTSNGTWGNDVYLSTAGYPAIIPFPGWAGIFNGAVSISGSLVKPGSTFLIDHPLDPANKYLQHSVVESPDRKNVYDGIAVLGAKGEAQVELPGWFGALNRDFRYQLTCLGEHAPVFIAKEVEGNRFQIAGGRPGLKVSWQVTGIRQDPWAKANPLTAETDKPAAERGSYLHPELYGQPAEKSWRRVHFPKDPEPPLSFLKAAGGGSTGDKGTSR